MGISKVIVNGVTKVDLTNDTVTTKTLIKDYTAHDASGTAIVGEGTGGVIIPDEAIFIDYDGTIISQYTSAEFNALTSLPPNPSHTGLTAQGWNWTLETAKAYLNKYGSIVIGQNYITTDGKTKLYITIDHPLQLGIRLSLGVNGSVSIDWGDGSSSTTLSGSSLTTAQTTSDHTYPMLGSYIISITCNSGKFTTSGTANSPGHFIRYASTVTPPSSSTSYYYPLYRILKKVELGTNFVGGSYSFDNSFGLETISVHNDISSIPNCFGCYNLKAFVIPYGVTNAGGFGSCRSINYISIPNTITSLTQEGFMGCRNLKIAMIPNSVSTIGSECFSNCASIKKIYIPKTTAFSNAVFKGCTSLREAIIDKEYSANTALNYAMFEDCKSLEKINFPSGITSIGQMTFYGCYSLSDIDLPSHITAIGVDAFDQCMSLKSISIPTSITELPNSTFHECRSLSEITIPSNVTSIGDSLFDTCENIKEVTFPSGVTSIPGYLFQNASNLYKVTFLGNITSIGNSAFYQCTYLKSITMPGSITSLGTSAFRGCSRLEVAPNLGTITSIPQYSFYNCSLLKSVTIPSTVTTIGNYAFYNCYSLTSITIPSSVTSIGSYVFYYCCGLQEIHFQSSTPPTVSAANTFSGLWSRCKIYVPTGSKPAYMSATNYPSTSTYSYVEE